jgi:hypothetical protein
VPSSPPPGGAGAVASRFYGPSEEAQLALALARAYYRLTVALGPSSLYEKFRYPGPLIPVLCRSEPNLTRVAVYKDLGARSRHCPYQPRLRERDRADCRRVFHLLSLASSSPPPLPAAAAATASYLSPPSPYPAMSPIPAPRAAATHAHKLKIPAPPKTLTPKRKHRKMLKDGSSEVWPEDVERVFVEGTRRLFSSSPDLSLTVIAS